MLNLGNKQVILRCGATDMRKSINGLMTIVESDFSLDPFEPVAYVFCNRKRDRIKILVWDGDGFWLCFKRLEKGHFRWPSARAGSETHSTEGDEQTITLTQEELSVLLNGVKVELKLRRNEVFERKII